MTAWFPTAAAAVLSGLWQGVLLAAAVWCWLRVLPANAATRYGVWLAALLAVVSLPWLGWRTPAEAQPGFAATVLTREPFAARSDFPPPLPVAPSPAPRGAAGWGLLALRIPAGSWPLWLAAGWLLGGAAMLGRLARSYRYARKLKRTCRLGEARYQSRLAHWTAVCGIRRPVRLAVSNSIAAPVSVALGEAVILLPAAGIEALSETEIDQVVLHELAHLRRWDDWSNLAQKPAQALWFFHPAVWWIARRLDFEREVACDDWVVAALGGERRSYAACLTRLIELAARTRRAAVVLGAGVNKRWMSRRIEMILDEARKVRPRVSRLALAAGLALVVGAVVVAAKAPPVVQVAQQPSAKQAPPASAAAPATQAAGQGRAPSLEEELRAAREELRALREENRRLLEEKRRDLEPKIRELSEQLYKLQREKREALDPQLQAVEKQMRQLQEGKLRGIAEQIQRLQEEKMRALEPTIRQLQSQMGMVEAQTAEAQARMREMLQKIERQQQEMMKSLEPRIRELQERLNRLP